MNLYLRAIYKSNNHIITESLWHLPASSCFFPHFSPGNHHSTSASTNLTFFPLIFHIWVILCRICLSLCLVSLSIMSSGFISVVTNGSISFFFLRLNNILLYIQIIHFLYPTTCQQGLVLFLYLGFCEHCCNEHRTTGISLR